MIGCRIGVFESELDVLEETKHHFVFQEPPHHVIGSAFVTFGVCIVVVGIHKWRGDWASNLVLLIAALWPLGLGVFGLLRSVISLDVNAGTLTVQRSALGSKIIERRFQSASVERVAVIETIKGNGLRIELRNRRRKSLSLFVRYRSLTGIADRMNHLICVSRRRR